MNSTPFLWAPQEPPAQELDVAGQEERAEKGRVDRARCTESELLAGSIRWQGSERAQAGDVELHPPAGRCAGSTKHFQLGA